MTHWKGCMNMNCLGQRPKSSNTKNRVPWVIKNTLSHSNQAAKMFISTREINSQLVPNSVAREINEKFHYTYVSFSLCIIVVVRFAVHHWRRRFGFHGVMFWDDDDAFWFARCQLRWRWSFFFRLQRLYENRNPLQTRRKELPFWC